MVRYVVPGHARFHCLIDVAGETILPPAAAAVGIKVNDVAEQETSISNERDVTAMLPAVLAATTTTLTK